MKITDVVKEDITRRGVAEDSSGLEKLHNTLWTAISEQTIDEETINEIDPGMMANLYSVFPTVAKIIVSNALSKARKEAKETSLMIDVMKKHANSQPVTPQENEAMLTQFKDIVSYGLSAVAGVLTATVAGPAAGAGVALAGAYKKELLALLQTKGPEVLIGLLKSKGKLDVVDILSAKLLGKHVLPFYAAPAKPPNSGIDQQGNKIKEQGMEEGEGNFVGNFPQPNIGGATVKSMQVGDTVSYFGQTAKIQAQSPDRKHSRIEITKGTGGVVQTVLTSDLKRVRRGMTEGMAQDEAEETSGWRAELVNQINYNTFEVKMTNTRSKESANFVVRPVDMISIGPTLQIETMDVHDLQTGQTESWTSDDPQPDGGIVYAIAMMFWDNKELQKKLWTIVDTHNNKGQATMPGLDQRRSIGQEVDADAYIDSQEKTQDVLAKMKQGMAEDDVGEGIRVPAQQILGTKNRAKSAYYPTNVKPKVPKLDKPLTDQELARLAQLAGIKSK